MRVLLHTTQCLRKRKVLYQPYGPWDHIPRGVWSTNPASNAPADEADDSESACQLCYSHSQTPIDSVIKSIHVFFWFCWMGLEHAMDPL